MKSSSLLFSCFDNLMYCFLFTTSICICIPSPAFSSSLPPPLTHIYKDHCSSIVPEFKPTIRSFNETTIPLLVTNWYIGGDKILGRKPPQKPNFYLTKSLKLQITPNNYYETIANGIYRVEQAYLYIRLPYGYYNNVRNSGSINISLNGFWSESSLKLCMVGSNLDVVLKLNFANKKNPTIFSSFISGVLESANSVNDSGYFDPLLIFSFPVLSNYSYSLVSKELDEGFSGDAYIPKNESLDLQEDSFCSMVSGRYAFFHLAYAKDCNETRNCAPLGRDNGNLLPSFMSLDLIQCSPEERKVRHIVRFRNITRGVFNQDFDVDWMFIGEGSWDLEKNKLYIIACRILNPVLNRVGNAVEDCTFRLSLRYPSAWTVTNDAKIVGQIWTNKTVYDPGYFRKITFVSSDENDMVVFPGLKYEYTVLNKVGNSCPVRKELVKEKKTYPDGHSLEMKFDMLIKNSKGKNIAWGSAMPLSVGNEFYQKHSNQTYEAEKKMVSLSPSNISYKIWIRSIPKVDFGYWFPTFNRSMNLRSRMEITAEGIYDVETGQLCMVGCRKLLSNNNNKSTKDSTDCEILVNFDFAALTAKTGGFVIGRIRSTRDKLDPLYFEDLSLLSAAVYRTAVKKLLWRMDMEITMVLISNTLICVFVGIQILHIKRNPDILSGISIFMLLILSIGLVIPLVLNFEALFFEDSHNEQRLWLRNGGRLEAYEITIRVVTVVAFLLQIRLLQLVWTAKTSNENETSSWDGEKKAFFVTLPMYILGCLLTLLLNRTRNKESLWNDLRSYSGLILDGFLFPQILLNVFRSSTEKALAHSFYVGTSFLRVVPHAYDQYRAKRYPRSYVNRTYYYANHTGEFYSTAWDIVITYGVIVLAVIVFLQQRYGGRSIIPWRSRQDFELYEKVPVVVSNEQLEN